MLKASANFIKTLKKQKRENSSLLFLDNFKIIKDALQGGLKVKCILLSDESKNIFDDSYPIYKVEHKIIEELSGSKTPQGVVCVTEYIQNVVKEPEDNFLVLDGLQDPGNVGTLIRTACACHVNDVYLISSVNATNSKLIRSSVGTIFKTNVMSLSREEFVQKAKLWNLNLLACNMEGQNIFDFSCNDKVGIVVGNEGNGVSDEILNLCKHKVKIPMRDGVESLNASISGAIILYQINKNKF